MNPRFIVYSHNLVIGNDQLITRKFIVLKDNAGLHFTDFHRYVLPVRVRNISDDGNNRFDFVTKFLNYIYFYKNIPCLTEVRAADVEEYLNRYGRGELPDKRDGRTKNTVNTCISSIMDFMERFIEENKGRCRIKKENLYKYVPVRDKTGRTHNKKMPAFDILYVNKPKEILRDIPNEAFHMLFDHISTHHTELLGLVSLSAFAGLRPSEACNVRRVDSPLGPGIVFHKYENTVEKVVIDLRREVCLRSDLKPTGKIKKERRAVVPYIFTDAFVSSYNRYMKYMDGKKYEAEYGAFSVNKQGRAITYDSYYQKFTKIIRDEMIPLYRDSDNPETALYGQMLMEHSISPHIFRHWYTVQLVLSGVSEVGELMSARGDTSPESCLTYLQNKGELMKKYQKVNNRMFDYLIWYGEKKKEEGKDV